MATVTRPQTAVPPAPTFGQAGFTLIELAIVMFIVSLLIGAMLMPLAAQQDVRARYETEKLLGEARDALLGYVIINGRLPCADTDGDGAENRNPDTTCTGSLEGDFPYQTVGTLQADGWNFRLRYRVSVSFSQTINLASTGDITVISRGDDPGVAGTQSKKAYNLAVAVPAVILSVGKNGRGGMPFSGPPRIPDPVAGTDESLNIVVTSPKSFVTRVPSANTTGCTDDEDETKPLCEFDDQLTWLSASIIINRMVSAGKLP